MSESVVVHEGIDDSKRRWVAITCVAGAGAGIATAVPFVSTFAPSERAKAAGAAVEVDISDLKVGEKKTVEWRGQPVWIVNRTPALLATLPQVDSRLRDPKSEMDQQPKYAQNETRSIKPEWLVVVGICTHLGCSPEFVPEIKPEPFDPEWKGGFFCPCHKSRYDIAGRVFQGVPAPMNLVVPPYQFVNDKQILIGVGPGEKA